MQNDLISKQSAIEKMWELYNAYGNDAEVYDELTTEAINREFSRLQRAIENMKTAYDVEKVVAELESITVSCKESVDFFNECGIKFLTKNKGTVYSIEQIYENVWNDEAYAAENIIAVHIRHIREKIEINPKEPKYLKVIWGIGYKIEKIS